MKVEDILKAYGEICFELGRWRGQVDLEESMENNFFDAFLGVLYDKKTSMPLHTVSCEGEQRAVKYNLRSEKWKEGVKKTTQDRKQENFELFLNIIKALGENTSQHQQ